MIFCYRNGLWNLLNWWIFGILVLGLSVRFNWISKKIWRKIRVLCKCFCGEWSAFWKNKKSYYLTNLALTEGKRKFPLPCIHSGEPWDWCYEMLVLWNFAIDHKLLYEPFGSMYLLRYAKRLITNLEGKQ